MNVGGKSSQIEICPFLRSSSSMRIFGIYAANSLGEGEMWFEASGTF